MEIPEISSLQAALPSLAFLAAPKPLRFAEPSTVNTRSCGKVLESCAFFKEKLEQKYKYVRSCLRDCEEDGNFLCRAQNPHIKDEQFLRENRGISRDLVEKDDEFQGEFAD